MATPELVSIILISRVSEYTGVEPLRLLSGSTAVYRLPRRIAVAHLQGAQQSSPGQCVEIQPGSAIATMRIVVTDSR